MHAHGAKQGRQDSAAPRGGRGGGEAGAPGAGPGRRGDRARRASAGDGAAALRRLHAVRLPRGGRRAARDQHAAVLRRARGVFSEGAAAARPVDPDNNSLNRLIDKGDKVRGGGKSSSSMDLRNRRTLPGA